MDTRMLAYCRLNNPAERRILELCFDGDTMRDFRPGLKMLFALNDAPLFVRLEEVDTSLHNDLIHCV